MSKSGLKAFVYSFSVSLFAILAANRAFSPAAPSDTPPLNISGKNITLFLKNNTTSRAPVKKIALNTLPELAQETKRPVPLQPEIILANDLEIIDIPLEKETSETVVQQLVLADVLYAPEIPAEMPEIDAEPLYTPEQENEPAFTAPPLKHEIKIAVKDTSAEPQMLYDTSFPQQNSSKKTSRKNSENNDLLLARAASADNFPLQKSSDTILNSRKINIGDPKDLNQVALSDKKVSIHSMEKKVSEIENVSKETKEWQRLNDSPWVVAKSNGVSRNKMADKDFANKTNEDIAKALSPSQDRAGVQVASETVKNLIIPIPTEIMQDENLTPKLAYPSSSEDAEKEKIIDSKLKKQEKLSDAAKSKKLLSPIEDDIELDVVKSPESAPVTPIKEAEKQPDTKPAQTKEDPPEKGGIMNALNSIFTTSQKNLSDAKEKAIAKAQAKRSFKKRLAKNRPVSIMPTEIRLSFQPNRAEISGQTLRWVQAFASKAAEASDVALEIRIDGTSAVNLQQKRLNLLHNILTNKGVEHNKINTVFTAREPNSFILRTITLGNNTTGDNKRKRNNHSNSQYIQW